MRALIVDDSAVSRAVVAAALRAAGIETIETASGEDALSLARQEQPDVIVLDWLMPHIEGTEVCRQLKCDASIMHIPILMLTMRDSVSSKITGLSAGADDYVTKPFEPDELVARVLALTRRSSQAFLFNPLTRLPGGPYIEQMVRQRLERGDIFAVALADLDNFKAYNDTYGYPRGDDVIKFLARLLREAARDAPDCFVGHVGGDDFVLVCHPDTLERRAPAIIVAFDEGIRDYYDPADLEAGGLRARDRRGEERFFPIMTISIAAVSNRSRTFQEYHQIGEVLAEMKRYAKSQPGSVWVMDRRRGAA